MTRTGQYLNSISMKTFLMRSIRFLYRKVKKPVFDGPRWCTDEERVITNQHIYRLLQNDEPVFIGRIGTTEQGTVLNYLNIVKREPIVKKLFQYIVDNIYLPWEWHKDVPERICTYSGFFPPNNLELLAKFCQLYVDDIPLIDLCGRYCYFEKFMPFKKDVISVQLETLYPFFVSSPWTRALKGKKVLVIHPFSESIKIQYKKRELLFDNPDILPEFHLKTITAVQSIANNTVPYKDWFEALESMKTKIKQTDFDISIIGCGAYGLPLGAYVKRIGKKAILLAGGTQLLFGIKGKRWERYPDSCYRDMFNKQWIYPSKEEKPKDAQKIEDGCYW